MYDPTDLIRNIEAECSIFFNDSTFHLDQYSFTKWKVASNYSTNAISKGRGTVNVIKWFDDIWLYLEIEFDLYPDEQETEAEAYTEEETNGKEDAEAEEYKEVFPNVFVSLSIFQGEDGDEVKNHLFRAEWDNYEDNTIHPQPHWHLHPVKYSHKKQDNFEAFLELMAEEGFENQLDSEHPDIIDLKEIHFAMNGEWSLKEGHIHRIGDEDTLIFWIQGLLGHIKSQLEYVNK